MKKFLTRQKWKVIQKCDGEKKNIADITDLTSLNFSMVVTCTPSQESLHISKEFDFSQNKAIFLIFQI